MRIRLREITNWRPSPLLGRGLGLVAAMALVASAISLPISAGAQPAVHGSSLTVNITGLPTGLEPRVTVTGPDGYSSSVHQPGTMRSLTAGQYTAWASPVKASAEPTGQLPPVDPIPGMSQSTCPLLRELLSTSTISTTSLKTCGSCLKERQHRYSPKDMTRNSTFSGRSPVRHTTTATYWSPRDAGRAERLRRQS